MEKLLNLDFIEWDEFKNKTILITGATGLIGKAIIDILDYINNKKGLNISVLAIVRSKEKARKRFSDIRCDGMIKYIVGSVEKAIEIRENVDFIIHAASQTASSEIVNHAVETIETSVLGTQNMLKLAKKFNVNGFVYLSSMEVYGYPEKGHRISENEVGALSPINIRNSYPISKVMAEAMCCAYANEYNVPAKICRLTQTFGEDVHDNDNRIFAYIGKCVREKRDIVLKTKGESERCYLHTFDAATAILTILLKGEPGHVYNAADESTYSSIAETAEKIANKAGVEVKYEMQDAKENGFPETVYIHLDTTALKELGWKPFYSSLDYFISKC